MKLNDWGLLFCVFILICVSALYLFDCVCMSLCVCIYIAETKRAFYIGITKNEIKQRIICHRKSLRDKKKKKAAITLIGIYLGEKD